MRVGIVSQYANSNAGNKLQNYAVQQMLFHYADDVLTLKSGNESRFIKRVLHQVIPVSVLYFASILLGNKRRAEYLRFQRKYISCSNKKYPLDEENMSIPHKDACNMYCAGSDQIWKPTSGVTGNIHYLVFADRERTFSYAASFGIDKIPEEHVEAVRKGLNHIKFISVREDAGKRIVEDLTGRTDVQVLVDPTMLLTTQEWDAVAEKPKHNLPEKYLLTYFLGEVSERRRRAVEAKAAELGCDTIWLMDKKSPFYAIGPGHFVYMIKHAEMVCTDSFHGSVFSFLYGRPLAIFDREGSLEDMGSRLETLASKFDLRDNLVKADDLSSISGRPDYSKGYEALAAERQKSKAFLDMVFEEAERIGICK